MSDIRLPEGIRPSVSKGYSMTLSNNVVRTGMQGGAPRQGLDTHYEAIPVNVTFILTGWQVQAFTAFLQAIDNGASSFIMTHDVGHGLREYQTWITSTINRDTPDGINWYVSFTATIEAIYDQCEETLYQNLLPLYQCYGGGLSTLLKAYGVAQTTHPRIWNPMQEQFVLVGDVWYYYDRDGNLCWWGPELEQGHAA